ncbi:MULTISPECIES: acetate/propionate family kinase [unclassified Frondihabitans]|uniref:acetate/propionate family kinase n=1 Tax=unclassified Frondihabitans TaxID=2626248 RepID=UPI000F4D5E23|nr:MULTISPECIES: acetate kinase [unclassified Frondihabitans]RPE78929.1 acetate kinase [Frondihabitans sp. PhB153]RPF09210.1 acetate kinase [Frondihabitans sp. PhB161]
MSAVLVVNSGSSSFKYQLIELEGERTLASGLVERIGEVTGVTKHKNAKTGDETSNDSIAIPDHAAGFAAMLKAFEQHGPSFDEHPLIAVGHRVVHGGSEFDRATVVTPDVEKAIERLSALAPLHNPANLQGIRAAREAFPDSPQVAVFDTAFHQTLAPAAYTYAIDAALAEKHSIRRYGFHGTSHKFVSQAAADFLGKPLAELKMIVLHIGNGASATAIDGGRSIETSMGLTPLEGLVMGTRSGDVDPAVVFHLHREERLSFEELETMLNKKSGLLGLTGNGDMRDVQDAASRGDEVAEGALAVYRHRIRHYVGAYIAQLGGLDAIVFTAGVGENNALLRRRTLLGLDFLGITIDDDRNELGSRDARYISAEGAPVAVLVVPTDEELEIARQAAALV